MNRKVFILGKDEIPSEIRLSEGESLEWTIVSLKGENAAVDLTVQLDGPHCEVDIAGLYLCSGADNFRLSIAMRHNSGECTSRQLFKGIVSDSAKASFDGLVYVKRNAQKTKAYQENHTILMSRDACVETCPQLEIYADDVECSHGATTGYLNEDELFYMRSRGISEEQARKLQIISFLSPVLERLPEETREQVLSQL